MRKAAICICLILLLSVCASGVTERPYNDVGADDWFYDVVMLCRDSGLMRGTGDGLFRPNELVSAEQGIVVLARLHWQENGNPEPTGADWFTPSYDYCLKWGLLNEGEYSAEQALTREWFADLLTRALPAAAFPAINEIETIPGYDASAATEAALLLYNAGIFTGTNEAGAFSPYRPITRAELAALLCRVTFPETRVRSSVDAPTTAARALTARAVPLRLNELVIETFDGDYIYACRPYTWDASLWGRAVFDLTGKAIFPWGKHNISTLSDGVFLTSTATTDWGSDERYDYYNADGVRLNSVSYTSGTVFQDGLAAVRDERGALHVIDKEFRTVRTLADADQLFPYRAPSGGYLALGPAYLMDIKTGEFVRPNYLEVSRFLGGIANVRGYSETDGSVFEQLVDTNWNELLPRRYERIYWGETHYAVKEHGGRWGVVDRTGNVTVTPQYDEIKCDNRAFGLFYRNGIVSLRNLADGALRLELPSDKDTQYQLYDRYLARLTYHPDSFADEHGFLCRLTIFDFDGNELFSDDNCSDVRLTQAGALYTKAGELWVVAA